jgi:hypothetical protein
MINNINLTPLVLFFIIVLAGACLLGVSMTNTEVLNPTLAKQQAGSNAMFDVATVQVIQVEGEATQQAVRSTAHYEDITGRLTAIPMERTLSAANLEPTMDAVRITQTAAAIAETQRRSNAEFAIWQTDERVRRERDEAQQQINMFVQYGGMTVAVLLVGVMIYLVKQVGARLTAEARVRVYEAEAKMLAEKRRLEEMRAVLRSPTVRHDQRKRDDQSYAPIPKVRSHIDR